MNLFTIQFNLGTESHTVGYDSVAAALDDPRLLDLMLPGTIAVIWSGDLRVTVDIKDWNTLRSQLVNNASTLLRRKLGSR